ncbi:MAG: histidine kinase dimerization/phospho-acceptor domain-containing protein [Hormoscilla sp.]
MSSLGQMVAGIAHEINNPVSFIYGNLEHAKEYTQELLKLLDVYQQEYPEPTPVIEEQIAESEIEYLV